MVTNRQLHEKVEGMWGKFAFMTAEDRILVHISNMLRLKYPMPRIKHELEKRCKDETNPDRIKVSNYFLHYIEGGK